MLCDADVVAPDDEDVGLAGVSARAVDARPSASAVAAINVAMMRFHFHWSFSGVMVGLQKL